jgi:hypothetical protein
MSNPFLSFTIKAIIVLAIIFCIHIAVLSALEFPLFENRIILSYLVNLLLIVFIFGVLYFFKEKYKSQLGFLFLYGSFLKFAVFFIVFYPYYNLDNTLTRPEFASFFVPYVFGLVLETISLSKWLNKLD